MIVGGRDDYMSLQKGNGEDEQSIVYTSNLACSLKPPYFLNHVFANEDFSNIVEEPFSNLRLISLWGYKKLFLDMIAAAADFNKMLRQPISYAFIEASIQNVFILVIDQNESSFTLESSIIRSFAQILYAETYGRHDMIVTTYPIASESPADNNLYESFTIQVTNGKLMFCCGEYLSLPRNPQYVPYHVPINQPEIGTEVSNLKAYQLPRKVVLDVVDSRMRDILPFRVVLYSEDLLERVPDITLLTVLHTLHYIGPSKSISLQHEFGYRYTLESQPRNAGFCMIFHATRAFHLELYPSINSYTDWKKEKLTLEQLSQNDYAKMSDMTVRLHSYFSSFMRFEPSFQASLANFLANDSSGPTTEIRVKFQPLMDKTKVPMKDVLAMMQLLHASIKGAYDVVGRIHEWPPNEVIRSGLIPCTRAIRVSLGKTNKDGQVENIVFTEARTGLRNDVRSASHAKYAAVHL